MPVCTHATNRRSPNVGTGSGKNCLMVRVLVKTGTIRKDYNPSIRIYLIQSEQRLLRPVTGSINLKLRQQFVQESNPSARSVEIARRDLAYWTVKEST